MSTRSVTTICDETGPVAEFYKHYDGYPEGWGSKLHTFLDGFVIRNGLSGNDAKVANGAGCLAAQIIAAFKGRPGDIYLQPVGAGRQEFNYTITAIPDEPIRMKLEGHGHTFDGLLSEFSAWLKAYEKRDGEVE